MLILWGVIWGVVFGSVFGRDSIFSGFYGGFWGFFAGLSLQLIVSSKLKQSVADAQRALAAAWEAEEARKQTAARLETLKSKKASEPQRDASAAMAASAQPAANVEVTPTAAPAPKVETNLADKAVEQQVAQPLTEPNLDRNPDGTLAALRKAKMENGGQQPAPRPTQATVPSAPSAIEVGILAAKNWLFGGNTVVRIGIVVLFLGLLFLAKFAVDNGFVPIEVRLAAIGLVAVALLVIGWRTKASRPGYALSLQGAAVAILYLTIFAAFKLYHLIDPKIAFAFMLAVCALSTALALLQNSRAMAVIGFTGGFLVPVLLSTGGGSHIALFSYFALLNIAVLVIAWFKTWRVLSVISFVLTFGIAGMWANDRYEAIYYASCQLFLLIGWAIYLAIALIYANRREDDARSSYVDGTLVFGMALVGFGLQAAMMRATPDLIHYASAFSALIAGGVYLALALWQASRARQEDAPRSAFLAGESLLAIGVGFATLAIPLAFGAEITAAAWAIEGAAIVWVGLRQQRWLARAFGLALQPVALITFYLGITDGAWERASEVTRFFLNTQFVGMLLIALGAVVIGWVLRRERDEEQAAEWESASALARAYLAVERLLAAIAIPYAFLIWCAAIVNELHRNLPPLASGDSYRVLLQRADLPLVTMIVLLVSVALSFVIGRRLQWAAAASIAFVALPSLMLLAAISVVNADAGFNRIGFIIWPLALIIHYWLMRANDEEMPSKWYAIAHAVTVWIVVVLAGGSLARLVTDADLWRTAWASVTLVVAAVAALALLIVWVQRATTNETAPERWPLQPYLQSYIFIAAIPLVIGTFAGGLALALLSNGNAAPLPYIPLLNPVELTVALVIAVGISWILLLRRLNMANSNVNSGDTWVPYSLLGFVLINTVWLRIAHHFFAVPWDAEKLFSSFFVQTGYAILWSVMALVMMVMGHRTARRGLWMLGAALLGLTVLKLIAIDMSNTGGVARVVAFIGVGVLILIVGFFAPLPPSTNTESQENPA
jgi:uncharacterized membrane protein